MGRQYGFLLLGSVLTGRGQKQIKDERYLINVYAPLLVPSLRKGSQTSYLSEFGKQKKQRRDSRSLVARARVDRSIERLS
jgi:hypothetical protein